MFELINQGVLLFIALEAAALVPAWLLVLLGWWGLSRRRKAIVGEPQDGIAGAVARFKGRDAAWEARRARRYGALQGVLLSPAWRPLLRALVWLQPLLLLWLFVGGAMLDRDAWLNRTLERVPEEAMLPIGLAVFFAPWVWAFVFAQMSSIPHKLGDRRRLSAFSSLPATPDARADIGAARDGMFAAIDEIEDALIGFLVATGLATSCVVLPLLWYALFGDPVDWLLED